MQSLSKTICALCWLAILCACSQVKYEYAFQDPRLSFEERAADLVSRLTLDEKIGQMLNRTPAVERLGIPAYDWWNECLHGIGRTEYAVTVFPQAIGMAAGWDAEAMRQMAEYTATEGRAIYNDAQRKGNQAIYHGLTYWTPNINVFRDPRWGRGQETYGEDPYLTATLGTNFVEGLQGNDKRYLKAAACAKHFAVHSGPEHNRHEFNVEVSQYDLWDTYLPAFKALTDAGVAGFMCAYNAFEGQPCCGSDKLMVDILRNDWGFAGYVTSDCGAIDDFYRHHKTHPDAPSAAADAVFHGTDLDCGKSAYLGLKTAVEKGLISEEQIDVSLKRLMLIRMRLGMFDAPAHVPFSAIDTVSLEDPAHKALSLKMARQSMTLLKNKNNLLPIDKQTLRKVAVVGPNIDNPEVQLGNYNGFPSRIITPLEGIREALGEHVVMESDTVVGYYGKTPGSFASTIDRIKDADLIVYVGGISPRIEGEEMNVVVEGFYRGDRTSIQLPKVQTDLMKALKATGKPLVFVMMTGSAIACGWEEANVDAILNAWYGGEFAGKAIADVLFGEYNPSGRLPVTFYADDNDLPDFEDYDMSNRTYKYFKGEALYPFGYGLSFTNFHYEWVDAPKTTYTVSDRIDCKVNVGNVGKRDGDEVAQLYIEYPQTGKRLPIKELRAFERTHVSAGNSVEVAFSIPVAQLSKWDDAAGTWVVPSGQYRLFVGGNSNDEAVAASFEIND